MWHTKVSVLSLVARDLLSSRHFDLHSFAHLFKVISFRGCLCPNILSIRCPPGSSSFSLVWKTGFYFLLQIDHWCPFVFVQFKSQFHPLFNLFFFFLFFLAEKEEEILLFSRSTAALFQRLLVLHTPSLTHTHTPIVGACKDQAATERLHHSRRDLRAKGVEKRFFFFLLFFQIKKHISCSAYRCWKLCPVTLRQRSANNLRALILGAACRSLFMYGRLLLFPP